MNKMGFGFLRLPKADANDENSVDFAKACALADRFIALGGNYFDTAYTYLRGNSEKAIREAVVKRYPRDKIRIADKLPTWKIRSFEDRDKYLSEMFERCGVDYFDVLMVHGIDRGNYVTCKKFELFEYVEAQRAAGKAVRTGFSFHGSPELLDEILNSHPEVDCVLLQINYLDWESPSIQSKKCYETAVKHGKRVLVMEPCKGGSLSNPTEEARKLLEGMHPDWSMAAWAMRFVQSLEHVEVVLSGMNEIEQIEDNLRDIAPLNSDELNALKKAAEIIRQNTAVGCTGCGYCVDGCPQKIAIPKYFALYNDYARSPKEVWKMGHAYEAIAAANGKAGDCIGCGQCESACPQKLEIIENLKKTAEVFEPKEA